MQQQTHNTFFLTAPTPTQVLPGLNDNIVKYLTSYYYLLVNEPSDSITIHKTEYAILHFIIQFLYTCQKSEINIQTITHLLKLDNELYADNKLSLSHLEIILNKYINNTYGQNVYKNYLDIKENTDSILFKNISNNIIHKLESLLNQKNISYVNENKYFYFR